VGRRQAAHLPVSDKATKDEADYTPRAAHRSERCKLCKFFADVARLYGECEKVSGNISPLGWCKFFERKS